MPTPGVMPRETTAAAVNPAVNPEGSPPATDTSPAQPDALDPMNPALLER